jgi:hypothetical protein
MTQFPRWVVAIPLLWLLHSSDSRGADSTSQSEEKPIPYDSVDDAEKALRAEKGVTFRNQDGWLIAEDIHSSTVWLLTLPGHPAYPSIVKRALINSADGAYMETNVRCLASEDVCDKFFGSK